MSLIRVLPVGKPIVRGEFLLEKFPGMGDIVFDILPPVQAVQTAECLQSGGIDLVLFIPDGVGMDLLELLKQTALETAAIVLADPYDTAQAAACLQGGAQDYLPMAGLSSQELGRAMIHAMERHALRRREVDERIRAEKALAETVERSRFLLNSLPQIVWTADPNGTLVYLNSFWVQYSGQGIQETLATGWADAIHPDDVILTQQRWKQSLESGEPFAVQHRLRALDKAYRWHESRAVPRRDSDGKILEWIGTEICIDEEKRVEERLKEAHDELGIRILERTSELAHANESLQAEVAERRRAEQVAQKAREVAEAANRSKTEFLANISHEIRTPMNGIIGMTELALETNLDLQQRECLQIVAHSADSLLTLINDMLDFAKIEAGRLELDNEPFLLRDTLEDVVKAMGVRTSQKGLKLQLEVLPDVPGKIVGDPLRLRQILLNLISNSVKFTEKGEVAVKVSVISVHNNLANLLFEVSDTGIGIPEDKQAVIFEAFAQGDGSMTRRYGGTGLGLAIVSSLVKKMGGDIRVRSRLGEGSTFAFNFQARVESYEEVKIEMPPVEAKTERYAGMRVLVVAEKRSATAMALQEMLKSLYLDSTVIGLGEEAMGEIERTQSQNAAYRLIMVDAALGDMSGAEFVYTLVKEHEIKAPVVLLLAGSASPEEIKQAWAAGPDWILYKPVIAADLMETLERSVLMVEPDNIQEVPAADVVIQKRETQPPLRVLVVEDNLVNQIVAERILMSLGCFIIKANNGREAVEAVEREPLDLILMDIQMPEMDGMEATRIIRSMPDERANLPIVAITAHAMKGDRERFLASGMDHYISKPFHKDELLLLVKAIAARVRKPSSGVPPIAQKDEAKSLLDGFLKAMGGDETLFRSACDLFAEMMPTRVAELGTMIEEHRAHDAERLAHNLRTSLDSVGIREVSEGVTVLEANLRSRDFAGASVLFEKIQGDIRAILQEISALPAV